MRQLALGAFLTLYLSLSLYADIYQKIVSDFSDEQLIVSNFPESIEYPGFVFDESMEKKSMRLLYHHRNIARKPLFINVVLTNRGESDAEVTITKGVGGSSRDVVYAGHYAMSSFLEHYMREGEKVIVPPGSVTQVLFQEIKSLQTVSGMLKFNRVRSDKLSVAMQIVDMSYPSISSLYSLSDSKQTYSVIFSDESLRKIEHYFDVSDKQSHFYIGGKPYLQDRRTGRVLKGNYGLLYLVDVFLENSRDEEKKVSFFASPLKDGGVDRGVFVLDGGLVETGVLSFKNRLLMMEQIGSLVLNPFEKRHVRLATIPQAGSYYPIDFAIRSL